MGVDSIVPPRWNRYACRLAPHIVKPMKNKWLSCLLKMKNTLSYSCSYAFSTSSGVSLYLTYHNIAMGEHPQRWLKDNLPDISISHAPTFLQMSETGYPAVRDQASSSYRCKCSDVNAILCHCLCLAHVPLLHKFWWTRKAHQIERLAGKLSHSLQWRNLRKALLAHIQALRDLFPPSAEWMG